MKIYGLGRAELRIRFANCAKPVYRQAGREIE